jgi:hypothetical protein
VARAQRQCSLCLVEIDPRETGHVIDMRYKYYDSYVVDIGKPSKRRRVLMCTECTEWFTEALRERLRGVRGDDRSD